MENSWPNLAAYCLPERPKRPERLERLERLERPGRETAHSLGVHLLIG